MQMLTAYVVQDSVDLPQVPPVDPVLLAQSNTARVSLSTAAQLAGHSTAWASSFRERRNFVVCLKAGHDVPCLDLVLLCWYCVAFVIFLLEWLCCG
jgi:hypothetical protein